MPTALIHRLITLILIIIIATIFLFACDDVPDTNQQTRRAVT